MISSYTYKNVEGKCLTFVQYRGRSQLREDGWQFSDKVFFAKVFFAIRKSQLAQNKILKGNILDLMEV